MMNDTPTTASKVTLDIKGETPVEAASEFRRFGRVKVVPEDGTFRTVQLSIQDAPMDAAVDQLAKWVNRKWAKIYALEARGGFQPPPQGGDEVTRVRPDFEQMRQRMENFQPTPAMQERATQRMLSGIKNSSAEQRAMQRRQRGGRGGPGGGGGGGGGPR